MPLRIWIRSKVLRDALDAYFAYWATPNRDSDRVRELAGAIMANLAGGIRDYKAVTVNDGTVTVVTAKKTWYLTRKQDYNFRKPR